MMSGRVGMNWTVKARPTSFGAGVQHLEAVGPLVAVALARQHRPDLFGREALGALDQVVGHLRTPVGKALERVVGGDLDELLAGQLEELRVAGSGEGHEDGRSQNVTGQWDHGRLLPVSAVLPTRRSLALAGAAYATSVG